MRRLSPVLLIAAALAFAPAVHAQEAPPAGRIELGAFPIGGVFFTNSHAASEPDFGNFVLGATVTYNVNRWFSIEGEIGNALGVNQNMRFGTVPLDRRDSPSMYAYSGNVVVNPMGAHAVLVPYLTAGLGGLTLYGGEDAQAWMGAFATTTYVTLNVGGGTKWYLNEHWGVRGDYRLLIVDNKPSAPEFFGRASVRYGHRVYGGLLFTY